MIVTGGGGVAAVLVEGAALALLAVLGLLLTSARHSGPWRVAVALPLGVAALCSAELVLVATGLPIAQPWTALLASIAVVGAVRWRAGRAVGEQHWRAAFAVPAGQRAALLGVAAAALVGLLTAWLPLVNVTFDSFDYLTISNLLPRDGDVARISGRLLLTRSLATSTPHGLAALPYPGYLRALGPLLALSVVAMLAVFTREVIRRLDPRLVGWLVGAAALLLATNHRFVYGAFFINSHMMVAAWMLLLAITSWRLLEGRTDAGPLAATTVTVSTLAITVARPEGALVVLTALLPVVVAGRLPLRWRQAVVVGAGLGNLVWHLVVARAHQPAGGPVTLEAVPTSVLGMLALGVATFVAAALLPVVDGRLGRRPLVVAHGLVWLAVAAASLRSPEILTASVAATARNLLWDGRWGTSLVVLALLVPVAVGVRRVRSESAYLFPLLTYIPLGLLLAFLREGAYRVGAGDSFNRILLHVVPLAVLALVLTAVGEPRHRRRASGSVSAPGA